MPARLLALLGRHAQPILAGGVFAGLLLPDLAAALYPLYRRALTGKTP